MTDYRPEDQASLPPIGFIAVQCFFYRPAGDAFNENTWAFPVIRELAEGSREDQLVTKVAYDDAFIDNFVAAGKKLAERGAVGILTSCGFLAMAQPLLAERLPIPVATSSLIQIPSILAWLPPSKKIGIITYNARELVSLHFERLGISKEHATRCHIAGAPDGGSLRLLVTGKGPYSFDDIEKEMVAAAKELMDEHPDIGAFVLECTQMPPFGESVQRVTGLPTCQPTYRYTPSHPKDDSLCLQDATTSRSQRQEQYEGIRTDADPAQERITVMLAIIRHILANRNQSEQAKQMAVKQQKSSKNDARFRAPVAFCWRGVLRSVPYEPRQLFLGSHKRTSQVRVAEGAMPLWAWDDADRAFEPQSSRGTHGIWSTTRFLPGEAHQKG
ncbi:Dimethlysulfonioproprionate lyase [Colletotrichum fructicola]|nr:Dimethlysulfonioproprionate lyase [Colletotrichum fructicola]